MRRIKDKRALSLNYSCVHSSSLYNLFVFVVNSLIPVKLDLLHDLIFRGRRDQGINCGNYCMGFAQKLPSYRPNFDIPGCNEAWFHPCCVWYVFLCQIIIVVEIYLILVDSYDMKTKNYDLMHCLNFLIGSMF